jgi:uncharacterized alpha-E superfamily protein
LLAALITGTDRQPHQTWSARRIRNLMTQDQWEVLKGIIEADEEHLDGKKWKKNQTSKRDKTDD